MTSFAFYYKIQYKIFDYIRKEKFHLSIIISLIIANLNKNLIKIGSTCRMEMERYNFSKNYIKLEYKIRHLHMIFKQRHHLKQ